MVFDILPTTLQQLFLCIPAAHELCLHFVKIGTAVLMPLLSKYKCWLDKSIR